MAAAGSGSLGNPLCQCDERLAAGNLHNLDCSSGGAEAIVDVHGHDACRAACERRV
jgi:hypothetical protein